MDRYIDFFTKLGFDESLTKEFICRENDTYDIDAYGDVYAGNIEAMKDEFDDEFIMEMFASFNTVFMRSDFCMMLGKIRKQFNTDMWSTLIQFEWNETCDSSAFGLMDSLVIGDFEASIERVCKKIRAVWEDAYGDIEL